MAAGVELRRHGLLLPPSLPEEEEEEEGEEEERGGEGSTDDTTHSDADWADNDEWAGDDGDGFSDDGWSSDPRDDGEVPPPQGSTATADVGGWAARRMALDHQHPRPLCCPITGTLFYTPVVASDGHTYEKAALEQWLARGHRSSPLTRQRLSPIADDDDDDDNRMFMVNFLAKQSVESHLGRPPTAPSPGAVTAAVLSFEGFRAVDQGKIRRRNRRERRQRAWEEAINHEDNWFSTVDPTSGSTYWYNRLTQVTSWEKPSAAEEGGHRGRAAAAGARRRLARPLSATHAKFEGFPGMKPLPRKQARPHPRGWYRHCVSLSALCVCLSAMLLVAVCATIVIYVAWLAGEAAWATALTPAAAEEEGV
jgi:hypothetical protein